MRTINIHQAKTHLSWLLERAVQGEPFIIAKAGRPMVKVAAIDAPEEAATQRTGFLSGEISVPKDFDRIRRDTPELASGGLP
jgi:prevent-host-death family protein